MGIIGKMGPCNGAAVTVSALCVITLACLTATVDTQFIVSDPSGHNVYTGVTQRIELGVSIHTSNSAPAIGQNVKLTCSVNDDTAEIRWYKDGVLLECGTVDNICVLKTAIMIVEFDVIHHGQYSCIAHREADGSSAEAVMGLGLLHITIHTSNSAPAIGQSVKLTCSVNGDTAEIRWYKDGLLLECGTLDSVCVWSNAIMVAEVDVIHQGQYSCIAYRGADGASGEAVIRIELPLEALFASYPSNATLELGGDHVLECSAANPHHTIMWEKDGDPLIMNERILQEQRRPEDMEDGSGWDNPSYSISDDASYSISDDEDLTEFPSEEEYKPAEFVHNLLLRDVTPAESGLYTCALHLGTQRIAQVSASLTIGQRVNENVCGTITAQEALNPVTSSRGRIVRGHVALRGSAPWMVRIYDFRVQRHICQGSLVNNYWVITVGHCIRQSGTRMDDMLIRLGDHDTRTTDDSEETALVEAIHIPDGFNGSIYDQDIALIKLKNPTFVINDYIRPICLPSVSITRAIDRIGTIGKVTGFGSIDENGPMPRYLNEVRLPLVGKKRCIASTAELVTDNMFCAGYPRESGDACRGDSGVPFAVEYSGRWYLFGVASWGEGCGRTGKYGFYTKVSNFVDWIDSYINH